MQYRSNSYSGLSIEWNAEKPRIAVIEIYFECFNSKLSWTSASELGEQQREISSFKKVFNGITSPVKIYGKVLYVKNECNDP